MDFTLAGTVILSGISIVFLVLLLLTFIVMLFGKLMSSGSKKNGSEPQKAVAEAPKAVKAAAPVVEDGISDELVAVISASIAAAMGGSEGFVIKSVKRAATAKGARPAWSMAGLQQNTNPF